MKRTKTYISIDIEAALIRGKQYIIEIGAVKWNPDGTTETFTQLVQPYKFKKLNQRIQDLTGITTEQLLTAPSFKQAIHAFKYWCTGDYVLLTFGEFDRKVLEEELARNYVKQQFLYPIIDFQQKYMIHKQVKEQPSLGGLMEELGLEVETQHRALADADSLLRIFQTVDGERIITDQETNEFKMILGTLKQQETTFTAQLTNVSAQIVDQQIKIISLETHVNELPFHYDKVTKTLANGETEENEVIRINASKETRAFIQSIIQSLHGEVIITRSGLKGLARLLRIHDSAFPKTEVMTLLNILQTEEVVERYKYNGEPVEKYEQKVKKLLSQHKKAIIGEFKKRALIKG